VRPPVPRVWFGLAFFFGVAATFVVTRTQENWTALVPVSPSVPLETLRVLLTLELMLLQSRSRQSGGPFEMDFSRAGRCTLTKPERIQTQAPRP
jgi:hypothetical protein